MAEVETIDSIRADRDAWKREAEMYQHAWVRELREFNGTIRRKSHLIDALVLTTREMVAKAKERAKGLPAAVTAWKEAEQERCEAVRACNARIAACREAGVLIEVRLEADRVHRAEQRLRDATTAMSVHFGCQPPPLIRLAAPEPAATGEG